MKRILRFSLLAFALIGTGGVQAIPLSALFDGDSIIAGDKLFDQWEVISYVTGDGRTLNADNIEVTALNDGGLDPGPGLSFSVSNDELTVEGDDIYNFVDFAFSFQVTAAPGFRIKDNSLALTEGTLSVSDTNDLGFTILEWVGSGPVLDPATPGYISTEFSQLSGVQTEQLTASSQFAPQQSIFVTKDILVWSVNSGETASLTGFEQRFSQQSVPEPGTLALLALAVVGMAVSRRSANT